MPHCRHNTITHIYGCILNVLLVTNVNNPSSLALVMVYSPIRILLALPGMKLQLISLAHCQCQHHMVLWNSLLSCVLTPPLTLSKLIKFSKNLATMLLLALSTPGILGTLNPCDSSMTMGERGEFTGFAFQQLLKLLNIKFVPCTHC